MTDVHIQKLYEGFKKWWEENIKKTFNVKTMDLTSIDDGESTQIGYNVVKWMDQNNAPKLYARIPNEYLLDKDEVVYRQIGGAGALVVCKYIQVDDKWTMKKIENHPLTKANRGYGLKRGTRDGHPTNSQSISLNLDASTYQSATPGPPSKRQKCSESRDNEDVAGVNESILRTTSECFQDDFDDDFEEEAEHIPTVRPDDSKLPSSQNVSDRHNTVSDNTTLITARDETPNDKFQKMFQDPDCLKLLDSLIEQRVNLKLAERLKQKTLKGKDRVVKKDKAGDCSWKKVLPEEEHDTEPSRMYFLPIEVFQDPRVKFQVKDNTDSDNAMSYISSFTICKKCKDRQDGKDDIFFNTTKRNAVCIICKNRQATKFESGFPLCYQCTKQSNDGNLDKDWNKQLLMTLFQLVQHQFISLNIQLVAEYKAQNPKAMGAGNWDKRCDFILSFTSIENVNGEACERNIVIYIELDKGQKAGCSPDKLKEDIRDAIKIKVKHINKQLKPHVLSIWKVNYDSPYKNEFQRTVSDVNLFLRMVILRQYAYFLIYNWNKLPAQHVWYFWYDHDKLPSLKEHWKKDVEDTIPDTNIHIIQCAPDDKDHKWKYCCDPTEGGCKMQGKIENNPFVKTIVETRKSPDAIFGTFPFKNLRSKFPVLKD